MKKTALILLSGLLVIASCKNSVTSGYDKSPNGLYYKKINITNSPKAKVGDFLNVNMVERTQRDSVFVNTRNANGFWQLQVREPAWKGDLAEGLTMLGAGDSISFLASVDTIYKKMGTVPPPFLKHGDYVKIDLKVVALKTKDQVDQERAAAMAEQANQEKDAINQYMQTNKIKAQQTASGLYYVIDKKGTGALPKPGQSVTVNYTGTLLDGTVFDSSLKPGRQPFSFVLGAGQVIKGWDEGVSLMPVGSKGRLIIPSALGYGAQGNGTIPANSPLVFSIEVISAGAPQAQPSATVGKPIMNFKPTKK